MNNISFQSESNSDRQRAKLNSEDYNIQLKKKRPINGKLNDLKQPSKQKKIERFVFLDNKVGNSKTRFPLFSDNEIGFKSTTVQESLVKLISDDDVDTDEEIYDRALKACSMDFNSTRKLAEKFPVKQIVNNAYLSQRVKRPELYDRCGRLFQGNQAPAQIHPSMNMIEQAKKAQSEKQAKF